MPGVGRGAGSVKVTTLGPERRGLPRAARVAVVVLVMLLTTAGVLVGARLVYGNASAQTTVPSSILDAKSVTLPPGTAVASGRPAAPPVAGSARLVLLGPKTLLDSRSALPAGSTVTVTLPALPAGSPAVLLEVSLINAIGPGDVTVGSGGGEITALRLPKAKAQTSATVVTLVGPDRSVQVRTEGGGRLLVNLVAAFEPAQASTSGRIVAVPATQVVRLIPKTDGKNATITLSKVPALRGAGKVSALLLHIAADVGPNGGFVELGPTAKKLTQKVFWSSTAGADRTRHGFLLVPVHGGAIHMHYEAGSRLTADIAGFVTGDTAPSSAAGLVVPVPPASSAPTRISARGQVDIPVVPSGGPPTERVAGVLVGITATGNATGIVDVHAPDAAKPHNPTLNVAKGAARLTFTVTRTVGGTVRVDSAAGASVTLTPQAFILNG